MSSDQIKKSIVIKSPVSRVWKALTDHKEYGIWFQCEIDRPFIVGEVVMGRMTIKGAEHLTFPMRILRMDENKLFSCEWPAYVEKTNLDLIKEPWLTMEFHLEEVPEGTKLSIVETGFDTLNAAIREEARKGNEGGWDFQLNNIRDYLHGKNE